jgi:uncharacterized phage protein (TIGR01671 family)
MNREIKFRAWDIGKKVFIPVEYWAVISNSDGATAVMLKDWEDYKEGEYFYPYNSTITQYTGLKDENGTEIYEGDVISSTPYLPSNPDERIISIIVYRNDLGRWNAECFGNLIGETDHLYGILKPPHQTEIIGNIYEHPHLINHPL